MLRRTTPGTTSRAASRRPTSRSARERPRREVELPPGGAAARPRGRADLVARARLARRPRRVHRGALALGRRRDRLQPAVGRDAHALVGDDHHAVDPEAAPVLPPHLLGVLGRPVRERRPAGPRGRAGARGGAPAAACATRQGHDGDPDRLGLRPPDVRSVPRGDARHLGAARGQDPGLGGDRDRDRARRRRPAVSRRLGKRASSTAMRSRDSARCG